MPSLGRILLVRFSSVGDIILTSPLIRNLRKAYPGAQIDFLTKTQHAVLVQYNPHLSSVIELGSGGWDELERLARELRREQYDLVVDLHGSLRSRFLSTLSMAPQVKTINKRIVPRFFLIHGKFHFYDRILPVPLRYLETVNDFGVGDDGCGLEMFLPDSTVENAHRKLDRMLEGTSGPLIAMAPCAKHNTKRWLPERFAECGAEAAKSVGAKIVILGAEEDREYCEEIAKSIRAKGGNGAAVNAAGEISLLESAPVLDRCELLLTNDTGMMHIAAARKRKVVAIFGPTVEEFGFFPFRTESIVVQNNSLPCRPCTHIGGEECPQGHFRCMKDISPEEVFSAVKELYAGSST